MTDTTLDPADALAIANLKGRYFRFVDQKEWAGLEQLFLEACVFEGLWAAAGSAAEFVANIARNFGSEVVSVHHGFMPELVAVDADTARGIWSMTDYLTWPPDSKAYLGVSLPGQWGVRGYGSYEEEYRRTPDGWKIAFLRLSRLRIDPLVGSDPHLDYPLIPHALDWLDQTAV